MTRPVTAHGVLFCFLFFFLLSFRGGVMDSWTMSFHAWAVDIPGSCGPVYLAHLALFTLVVCLPSYILVLEFSGEASDGAIDGWKRERCLRAGLE